MAGLGSGVHNKQKAQLYAEYKKTTKHPMKWQKFLTHLAETKRQRIEKTRI